MRDDSFHPSSFILHPLDARPGDERRGLWLRQRLDAGQVARDTDPQVVGVVADALQQAQRFGKDDVGFGVALAGFHAPDVQVADLPVQRVELALGRADFQGQDGVVVAEGAQRPGVNRVGKARELRQKMCIRDR